ncbi:MAG: hypothetical protein ACJ74Q_15085 [Pyrinomonadaceae bacterium]
MSATHIDTTSNEASPAEARAFTTVPHYVADLSLRIPDGADIHEGYFNFGLATGAFVEHALVYYPRRGVTTPDITPGLVVAVLRDRAIRIGVFDTLTDALVALSHHVTLPEYDAEPGATKHESASAFFEHCVLLGVACPRYQAEATRREREELRDALARERAHAPE